MFNSTVLSCEKHAACVQICCNYDVGQLDPNNPALSQQKPTLDYCTALLSNSTQCLLARLRAGLCSIMHLISALLNAPVSLPTAFILPVVQVISIGKICSTVSSAIKK